MKLEKGDQCKIVAVPFGSETKQVIILHDGYRYRGFVVGESEDWEIIMDHKHSEFEYADNVAELLLASLPDCPQEILDTLPEIRC